MLESCNHLAVVLRNCFILRLAQLSWGLGTSSGEFSYRDFRYGWAQLPVSALEDPACEAGVDVCLHPGHCSSDPGGLVQAESPAFFRVSL